MKPIQFKKANMIIGKDQPEYLPLPAHACKDSQGTIISCWQLSFIERIKLLFTGTLWLSQLTFGDALQPQLPQVSNPFERR